MRTPTSTHPPARPSAGPGEPRRQIIDTAARMFAEHGYGGTSLQAIASEVGYSKSTVLYHFSAKAQVLRELLLPAVAALAALDGSVAELPDPAAQEAATRGLVELALQHRHALKVFPGALRDVATMPELADLQLEQIGERLVEAMAGRDATGADRAVALMLVLGIPAAVGELGDLPDDEVRDALVGAARRALGGSQPQPDPERST